MCCRATDGFLVLILFWRNLSFVESCCRGSTCMDVYAAAGSSRCMSLLYRVCMVVFVDIYIYVITNLPCLLGPQGNTFYVSA